MTPPDVVGPAEARALIGNVSRQRFHQLRAKPHQDAGPFPQPIRLEIGDVYDRAEVLAWHLDRTWPGRKKKLSFLMGYRHHGILSRACRTAGIADSTGRRWLRALGVPLPSER